MPNRKHMKTHKKLLTTLVQGARIARLNAPHAKDQRVRIDLSVREVDALEAEAQAVNKHINDLEMQLNSLQWGDLESTHYCCRD